MYTHAKRAGDFCVALISIIVLSPVLIIVAILIKLDSKGPIVFKHKRYGKDKKPFTIYKFRTMSVDAPRDSATSSLINAHSYITSTGKYLRKLSIDELPQFFNVLKGDMSLVGPRPVVLQEADLIKERDKYGANGCTPGITGWAQANGRDEVSIYEKARLDGEYAANQSLRMDALCLIKTVETMIFAKGYREGMQPIATAFPQPQKQQSFYARVRPRKKAATRSVQRHHTENPIQVAANNIDI